MDKDKPQKMEEEKAAKSTESKETLPTVTFLSWKYRNYFKLITKIEEKTKNVQVACTLCPATAKPLSTFFNTTSNLKKHLNNIHPTVSLIPVGYKEQEGGPPIPKKQKTLLQFSDHSRPKGISSDGLLRAIADYIVEDMEPISKVESPAFKKLIYDVSNGSVQSLPCRRTISSHLLQMASQSELELKAAFTESR